jgi:hypothetical protein
VIRYGIDFLSGSIVVESIQETGYYPAITPRCTGPAQCKLGVVVSSDDPVIVEKLVKIIGSCLRNPNQPKDTLQFMQ